MRRVLHSSNATLESRPVTARRFLLIAGFADSLLGFRGPLITALQAQGLQVLVAAQHMRWARCNANRSVS